MGVFVGDTPFCGDSRDHHHQQLTIKALCVVVCQATVAVRDGVDIIQTNMSFLRQQFTRMAMHILRCNGKESAA